jgi:hypothetical protein
MDLTFHEADFLMHCMDLFCLDFSSDIPPSFTDDERKEVYLNHKQLKDLYLRLQELKFATN